MPTPDKVLNADPDTSLQVRPDTGKVPRIGLALGGGGARGFAHVHALQAFDDLGIRPSALAGTSIGALIGAAYASGMSGDQVEAFVRKRFRSRVRIVNDLLVFNRNKLPKLAEAVSGKFYELNLEKALALLMPENLPVDFAGLEIPLRVSATDFDAQQATALHAGPLLQALAASAAMPGLFSPIRLEDKFYIDGTLTNPVPFDILDDDLDIIVAIDVCGFPRRQNGSKPKRVDVMTASSHIMQQAIVRAKAREYRPDILVRPNVGGVRVHDFMKITRVLDATLPLRESLKADIGRAITVWREKTRPPNA